MVRQTAEDVIDLGSGVCSYAVSKIICYTDAIVDHKSAFLYPQMVNIYAPTVVKVIHLTMF